MATAETTRLKLSAGAPVISGGRPGARLESLDVFRGLVIVVMTFVNYLAGVSHIPAWAKHLPAEAEGYTFVDVVFPAFLFIVGVAIPLAFHRRVAEGQNLPALVRRILMRSASLIFVGVLLVNAPVYAPESAVLGKSLWCLLGLICVFVVWGEFPARLAWERSRWVLGMRVAAGVGLAILVLLFRGKSASGDVVWLQHSWWGIPGLIGWAYLVCSLLYLASRANQVALMGLLGFLLALYVGDRHGALDWLGPLRSFVGIGPVLGSTAADVMMGVLVGNCFVGERASMSNRARARFFLLFGLGLYCTGELVRPLHGINKIAATESYALVTGGICCVLFALVFWVVDMRGVSRWAAPLAPIGRNALLAYLLPGLVGNFLGVFATRDVLWLFHSGGLGALNATALTLLICLLTWLACRAGYWLRL